MSERDAEIRALAAEGLTAARIAVRLGIGGNKAARIVRELGVQQTRTPGNKKQHTSRRFCTACGRPVTNDESTDYRCCEYHRGWA